MPIHIRLDHIVIQPIIQVMRKIGNTMSVVLKGMLIGIANVIPGVSGGTIAVIVGIYSRLIDALGSLTHFDAQWKHRVWFLMLVAIGMLIGGFLFAGGMEWLFEHYPFPTALFLIGLIIGALPLLYRLYRASTPAPYTWIAFGLGFAIVVLLGLLPDTPIYNGDTERTTVSVLVLFASGIAGAAAMIVPGLSGSFILLLIGTYGAILNGVVERDVVTIAIAGAGALCGVLSISRLIRWLLRRYFSISMATILGLVVGSPIRLWPRMPEAGEHFSALLIAGILAAATGFVLSLSLTLFRHSPSSPK